ncbi:MAG: low molecular weight protein-tyrosine-phosphatase [Bacteroidia bacterium]
MISILMVCLGNICRSPLAEGILRHRLDERGIHHIRVDSAGTSGFHAGHHPDTRTIHNALTHQVDLSKLVSRQFTHRDFDAFDFIYVMDSSNYRDVMALAKTEAEKAKVDLLLNTIWDGENRAVPDPYYGGESGFENVFQLVDQACTKLANDLLKQKK